MKNHPYPRGTLVRVKTTYLVIEHCFRALGHRRPERVYWPPDWASTDIGRLIGRGRPGDGLLPGLVLKSMDAETLGKIPEAYKISKEYEVPMEHPRYTVYLVLIGDDPPLWFPWTDITELQESDDVSEI